MAFSKTPPRASRTLRVLARLLSYPDAETRDNLSAMTAALHDEGALDERRLAELQALLTWLADTTPLEAEAAYVELFDRGRATSLHLFEHVHGDSRERGPAMIDLAQSYAVAGLFLAPGELPDYLPVVLEFASTQPPSSARSFLAEMAHLLQVICAALQERQSPYAAVLGALIELAGENAAATPSVAVVAELPLDASWAEPLVFDGCSALGQTAPAPTQAIHLVRKTALEGVRP